MTLSEELQWRGFVNQTTFTDLAQLDAETRTFYLGVDPSAPSMTIGNLAVIMMVGQFIKHGHQAILLVGGATGMIGDPDGKKQERDLMTLEQIATNKQAIAAQYKQVLGDAPFTVVDNYDWFKGIGYLDFLRDVGKHVPMRAMLGRDFVQSRLGEGGTGISYAEFSYSLIQGYDFVHLYKEHGVTLQICGADQWGNSIAGVDLVRRMHGAEAHIWSAPLVVNKATGVKFGKSEEGAVWLDSDQTSIYKFYQFWLNVDDEGVADYLKIYTHITPEEHEALMAEFVANKGSRAAQKYLAYQVTSIVHGPEAANTAQRITDVLFGGKSTDEIRLEDVTALTAELPHAMVSVGDRVTDSLVATGLASSQSEARRFVAGQAVSVNGEKITEDFVWNAENMGDIGAALLRRGKNSYAVITVNAPV